MKKSNSSETKHNKSFYFSVELAKFLGVREAIILNHISYWVNSNKERKSKYHYRDGKYWTFLSNHEISMTFPFWNERQIRTIMNNLITSNAVLKGDYGKKLYYKATWYTVDDDIISYIIEDKDINLKDKFPEFKLDKKCLVNKSKSLKKPKKKKVKVKFKKKAIS